MNQEFDYHQINNPEQLYLGSIQCVGNKYYTTNSRTAAVVGIGKTISEAERIAESEISKHNGPLFHREDIGLENIYK
ncbi:MAG: phosphoribosylglycinamide synthetase C domain-containing protein [bacterium]|nr:phosphoribosylglycinamide synthetase C domain-containing protein [bacterium]